jgi:RHS repeat-associated protein
MDDKQRLALVETRTQGDDGSPPQVIRYQFSNQIGSTSLELDVDGQIISYEEYYPYGSTSYQAGRSAVEVSLKRYRFIGKERDEETGLNYHGERYYAPWLARWITKDPAGLVDGSNLYQYSRNNPIVRLDAKGTDSKRTYKLGPLLDDTGLYLNPLNNSELNSEATNLALGLLARVAKNRGWAWIVASWIAQVYPTVFSHEGGHRAEAEAQGGNPHFEWPIYIIPTKTVYGGSVNALGDARGINQNWRNAHEYWPILKLSGETRWADRGGIWANQGYSLYYTLIRTVLGVGPQDGNDIKNYAKATGASVGGLIAGSVTTSALNLGSEIFAKRIEGLLGNKVIAPRFEALLTLSGETLFGIQTIIKPSSFFPVEVSLNSTLSFSQFSAEAKIHDVKLQGFPTPLSVTIGGSLGRSETGLTGSFGFDFKYKLTSCLNVGVEFGAIGKGHPVHQVEGDKPGGYASANVQVNF